MREDTNFKGSDLSCPSIYFLFYDKMKLSDYCQYNNPLAVNILKCNFIEERTEHSYNLRHDRPPRVWTNTERFGGFVRNC